jgi:hypothetical protein
VTAKGPLILLRQTDISRELAWWMYNRANPLGST